MTTTSKPWRAQRPAPVIALRGPDARRFANGMFTNNVRDLPVGAHQHSAMTDDRGRLGGLLDLVCVDEQTLVLALDGPDADQFEATYGAFILFDDVEVQRPDAAVHLLFGVQPPPGSWPSPRVEGAVELLVYGPLPPQLQALPERPHAQVEALRIAQGWPAFADASDKQLPHELNLRDTHLHFEKGCYRGQETIHRVDVMGQVRKGLVGLRLGALAPVGTSVRADGKEVGRLGTSAVHPVLGPIGLAVLRHTHGSPGQAVEVDGQPAQVAALPFTPT